MIFINQQKNHFHFNMQKTIITISLILLMILAPHASCYSQEKRATKFSFELQENTLKDALIELVEKTDYKFSYKESLVNYQHIDKMQFHNEDIKSILNKLLAGSQIEYQLINRIVILKEKKNAKRFTISGTITDKKTGESLIGANFICLNKAIGTTSNHYGFYSFTLPEGKWTIEIRYIGYKTVKKNIELNKNIRLDIELSSQENQLGEVIINENKSNEAIDNLNIGRQSVNINTIKSMPALLGEPDVLKSLQMLPGVQAASDASANFNVRGGSYDQNLVLLDDAPIYNPSHSLGFFSIFNPDAIKNVEIYKGGIPAQYGGRLSSVVDIRMKEGDMKEYHGDLSVGTIASRLSLEGPIAKDKASFIVSGRYSYAGMTADGFVSLLDVMGINGGALRDYNTGNDVSFYDLNMKLNYKINENNRLFFSAYTGRDQFYYKFIDEKSSMDWGNNSGTLRWNHIFSDRLFSNTTLVFSNYDYSYYIKDDIRNYEWSSDLKEYILKSDYDYFITPENRLKYGISLNYHQIQPGKIMPRSEQSVTKPYAMPSNSSLESSIYASHELNISSKLALKYGFRVTSFLNIGPGVVYDYKTEKKEVKTNTTTYNNGEIMSSFYGFEPRLNLRYKLNENQSIKASYNRTGQYLHLISNSSLGLPTDIWQPSNKHIKPLVADQVSIGYYQNSKNKKWEWSIETYFKHMQNKVAFKDNANLFLNTQIEQEMLSGTGKAYGVEIMLKKELGRLKGWMSYTWSKSENQIDGINQGKAFPTRYDKPHDFSLYLDYQLSDRWSVNSNFSYTTGGTATIAKGSFEYDGTVINYYSDRNGYRLPDYHRLDLSFTRKGKPNRKFQTEWIFAFYNVYNRHNTFSIVNKQDSYDLNSNESYSLYMFGIVPSVSFNVKF